MFRDYFILILFYDMILRETLAQPKDNLIIKFREPHDYHSLYICAVDILFLSPALREIPLSLVLPNHHHFQEPLIEVEIDSTNSPETTDWSTYLRRG